MKIGIIDADMLDENSGLNHFPNLACMKMSAYHKAKGHSVKHITSWNDVKYDKIYISKVFTKTKYPEEILNLPIVEYGGTGFFFDKAPSLPDEIEHHKPDYSFYSKWVDEKIKTSTSSRISHKLKYHTDYSIGFTSKGCSRKCDFCVNRNSIASVKHSHPSEFIDESKKYIALCDDNIFACKDWKTIIEELNATGKKFQFRQGLDIRLMTEEKAQVIANSNYLTQNLGYIFAFDNYEDKDMILDRLSMWRKIAPKKPTTFYVLTTFDRNNKYDIDFWKRDTIELMERICIIRKYKCIPYIMRFEKYLEAPELYRQFIGSCVMPWTNFAPNFVMTLRENSEKYKKVKILNSILKEIPEINKYLDIKW